MDLALIFSSDIVEIFLYDLLLRRLLIFVREEIGIVVFRNLPILVDIFAI
jgi:hypothetical protein